ncbi:MAG: sensor histidine kinase [Oligoflexales bacterium]
MLEISFKTLGLGISLAVVALSAVLYSRTRQRTFAAMVGLFLSHALLFQVWSDWPFGELVSSYLLVASYWFLLREMSVKSLLKATILTATVFFGVGICAKYYMITLNPDPASQSAYGLSYLAFALASGAIGWHLFHASRTISPHLMRWSCLGFILSVSAHVAYLEKAVGPVAALLSSVGLAIQLWSNLLFYLDNQSEILELTRKIRDRLLFDKSEQDKRLADAEGKLTNEKIKSINSARKVALGEMAGGIAHEINNPLAIIRCYADFLQSSVDESGAIKLDERSENAFKALDRGIDRIADIVNNMRKLATDSSSESGDALEVNRVISSAVQFCQKRFLTHNVALEIARVPSDILIRGEMQQLIQVVLNLLQNSFKAVANLEESWISIDYRIKGDRIQVRITDSGHGIDSAIAERIFQPFFTTNPPGQGVGLGLSLSQGIVEAQGGLLFLDRASKNTRFIIELPMHRQESDAIPESA